VVAEELVDNGYHVVVLDNLQQGHRDAIPPQAEFVMADICDVDSLEHIFRTFDISVVVHLAADSVVGESIGEPGRFFMNNVASGIIMLNTMMKSGVRKFVFSSSASIYGDPETTPIAEDHPKRPVNPYGESKLMLEKILEWYGSAYGLAHVSLRYFNAAGATLLSGEAHRPETHLIPNILRAALDRSGSVPVFGTNYRTRDGSCVRDYIHVADIARAHLLALEKLDGLRGRAYNLGSGSGYSVLEVIETARRVTGIDIPVKLCDRRAGDPGELVAGSDLARAELNWRPRFALEIMIESAWQWVLQHPAGYGSQLCEAPITNRTF
jgi:UDP-glucose 4-epimerase